MFWRVVGLGLEIEGAMLLVVMRQRSESVTWTEQWRVSLQVRQW